jgi:hypothetical protein
VQLESAPLYLVIKNSSTAKPMGSVPVQVEKATPTNWCPNQTQTALTNLGTMETNANGSIEVCCTGSTFYFGIQYKGANHQLNATAEGAESAECVTFYMPSTISTITYTQLFHYQC